MEGFEGIQFIAKLGDWVSVKKLKVEKATEPREVAEFLISLAMSANRKIEDFLAEEIDFETIKKAIDDISSEEPLKVLENATVRRVIRQAIKNRKTLDKKVVKEFEELAKVFALRYALKKAGYKIDYSEVETPSLKLVKKLGKKVK
ncbi:MAG: DUF2666 family protein [Candidatus Diapherotrites archaeon]|nr:DUF2666 family protein [Candidatus Diapherotrites archaeon]